AGQGPDPAGGPDSREGTVLPSLSQGYRGRADHAGSGREAGHQPPGRRRVARDHRRREGGGMSAALFELADRLRTLKDRKAALEDELKQVNAEIERVDQELAQAMVAEEIQNFVRGDKLYYLKTE